ncbi:exodeoxyribonuclease VII large subunit [Methanosphaera sp.]
MQDKQIFKISTITVIIGILGLILTYGYVIPEQLTINNIDNSKLDNQVEISGIIESQTITKTGTRIIKLTDNTGSINLVIFSSTLIESELSNGMNITVTGKVTNYNGQVELILEEENNLRI